MDRCEHASLKEAQAQKSQRPCHPRIQQSRQWGHILAQPAVPPLSDQASWVGGYLPLRLCGQLWLLQWLQTEAKAKVGESHTLWPSDRHPERKLLLLSDITLCAIPGWEHSRPWKWNQWRGLSPPFVWPSSLHWVWHSHAGYAQGTGQP